MRTLSEYYQAEDTDCVHVWLSADADHFCSSAGDRGWGCGYRNLQMLLSALHRLETFGSVLQGRRPPSWALWCRCEVLNQSGRCPPGGTVPSIPQLQRMIEGAWREGLDPQGASHFKQRLLGTRAWIGATEVFSLLTSLGIRWEPPASLPRHRAGTASLAVLIGQSGFLSTRQEVVRGRGGVLA